MKIEVEETDAQHKKDTELALWGGKGEYIYMTVVTATSWV